MISGGCDRMKFRIHFSSNTERVPFTYPHQLCGLFHHWLGDNRLHDMLSLYSLGWLQGGEAEKGGLQFPKGAWWEIGVFDDAIAEDLIRGLLLKPFEFHGMQIRKVLPVEPPEWEEGETRFKAGSPILLRRNNEDQTKTHILYDSPESASLIMKRVLTRKLEEAGKQDLADSVTLRFDETYPKPKTRLVDIKGIKNKASVCPVIVEGPPEVREFVWNVGVGELTGVGFGSMVAGRNGS